MRRLLICAFVANLFAGHTCTFAGTRQFSLEGVITSAEAGNPFGAAVGDRISVVGEYDDAFYDGVGLGLVPFGDGTGNLLSITIGSATWNQGDDDFYSSGVYPSIVFDDGRALWLDFLDLPPSVSGFLFGSSRAGFDAGTEDFLGHIQGEWIRPLPVVDPGLLGDQGKFRGRSLEEWSVLAAEWQIASNLGDPSQFSDSVDGVRFLPDASGSGEFEFDVTLEAGTPFVALSLSVFGELYDDGTQSNPLSPFIGVLQSYTTVETVLDGTVMLKGFVSDNLPGFEDFRFGPVVFDEPIVYAEPQPRGSGRNAVAATFDFGLGAVYSPLPVGKHKLENTIESLYFDDIHITYNITVVPRKH